MKHKTPTTHPTNTSLQTSNVSSIMTSLTETTIDQTPDSDKIETSVDSIAVKVIKEPVVRPADTSDVSRQSSVVVEDNQSEMTFDGDEDDSVYQAIRSSQRSGRSSQQQGD